LRLTVTAFSERGRPRVRIVDDEGVRPTRGVLELAVGVEAVVENQEAAIVCR